MKVFYAHCVAIYGTEEEKRDVKFLENLGYKIFNPNTPEYQKQYKEKGMSCSIDFIKSCDLLVFKSLPGGVIPSGVYKEIEIARELNKPIIEIPVFSYRKILTLEETRLYLHEVGQR